MNGFQDETKFHEEIKEILQILFKKRRNAKCDTKLITNQNVSDIEMLNNYVELLGYQGIDIWRNLELIEAKKVINYILSRHLAYNGLVMQLHQAQEISNKFLSFFNEARFYCNGEFEKDRQSVLKLRGFSPISNSTFDAGIIVIDKERIGIIWVEDED